MSALKKILVEMASPRPRGNSTVLAGEAARGAEEAYALGRALGS